MLRSINETENSQLGFALVGATALLASGGMAARQQPASRARKAGCRQRTFGDPVGNLPSGPRWLAAVVLCVLLLPLAASAADWNQWGGTPVRNNVSTATGLPSSWTPGDFDAETGRWKPETSENVAWVA